MDLLFIFALAAAVLVGVSAGALVHRRVTTKRIGDADELAKRIVEEARKEAQAQKKEILLQGQDDLFNQKRELENEFKERERDVKMVKQNTRRIQALHNIHGCLRHIFLPLIGKYEKIRIFRINCVRIQLHAPKK